MTDYVTKTTYLSNYGRNHHSLFQGSSFCITPSVFLKYSNFTLVKQLFRINYKLIRFQVLEIHCSYLHHLPDIVEVDLYVLRRVMEHWVL